KLPAGAGGPGTGVSSSQSIVSLSCPITDLCGEWIRAGLWNAEIEFRLPSVHAPFEFAKSLCNRRPPSSVHQGGRLMDRRTFLRILGTSGAGAAAAALIAACGGSDGGSSSKPA